MKVEFFKAMSFIGMLAARLIETSADGKITFKEGIKIIEEVCDSLGIDFDKSGIDLIEKKIEIKD